MSGLEAIGAAAAILQFVDFGSKLLVTGYDVYKSQAGTTSQTIHVQSLCTELSDISGRLSQAPAGNVTLNDKERSLWQLADRAHDLAWHLGLLLDSLKLRKSTFRSWGAIRQSWRLLHQKEKITEMTLQLKEIKSLMDTSLLVLLRDDTSLIIKLVNEQIQKNKHSHDDNINAIQTLKHELVFTMRTHRDEVLQHDGVLLRTIGDDLAKLARRSTALQKSEHILESLYCEEVYRRELGVSEAEARTLSWAFGAWCTRHRFDCGCSCSPSMKAVSDVECQHISVPQRPCVGQDSCQKHLIKWLEGITNEPFMITGKPGSGKSTFMKFISSHEQTRRALETWSSGRKLVIASFYFWSSGTPLQRSRDGLLRCLLYRVLSQAPEAIPIANPQRWQTADQTRTVVPWSHEEISDAFVNVINANLSSTSFCFFIDGLDEYGGSDLLPSECDLDLILQLKALASSPHMKLCLSSRPRNVFKAHFPSAGSHHIILHDHTTKDIERLIESRIERVQGLVSIEDADLAELKGIIVKRSSGVFLWVVLVFRELLDGFQPPFSMPELRDRLLLLPATLDGFFQRILDRVHQQYRRFNARLLLMSVHHHQLGLAYIHFLWLLEHDGNMPRLRSVIDKGPKQLRLESKSWRGDTRARIKKICGDFLTIEHERLGQHWHDCQYIEYNHRSVADFLRLSGVRKELFALAGWHDESDVHLTLCKTFVSGCQEGVIRIEPHSPEFVDFFQQAQLYERHSGKSCAGLMYRLDSLLYPGLAPPARHGVQHWTGRFFNICHQEWAGSEAQALLLYATHHGLALFVEQAIRSLSTEAQTATLNDLLRAVLLGCYHFPAAFYSNSLPTMVEVLCAKGANVNSIVRTNSKTPHIANANITAEHFQSFGSIKSQITFPLDSGDSNTELTGNTIWEIYLQQRRFTCTHLFIWQYNGLDAADLPVKLIEFGADLRCELPGDSENIYQAIVKRLESETRDRSPLNDSETGRVRAALSRRGFAP